MAPEAIVGEIPASQRHLVDIYALGVIAAEMLTGSHPFGGRSIAELMLGHLQGNARDIRELRPEIPLRVALLVREMMAKNPADRPQMTETIVHCLEAEREALRRRSLPLPARANILVVTPEPQSAERVRTVVELMASGTSTLRVARTAEVAIDLLTSLPHDLVLVELDAPSLNGVEFCMNLQSIPVLPKCVVVFGGAPQEGDLQLLARLGVDQFIPKRAFFTGRLATVVATVVSEVCSRR
jgi:serine/threonine protein kinase